MQQGFADVRGAVVFWMGFVEKVMMCMLLLYIISDTCLTFLKWGLANEASGWEGNLAPGLFVLVGWSGSGFQI